MANEIRKITLNQYNDGSGPAYNVEYSTDCITYSQSLDCTNLFLPSVGSFGLCTVDENTTCIRLTSLNTFCTNSVIENLITTTTTAGPTTTTTTGAPTTTTTSTTSTTTTTTSTTSTTTTLAPTTTTTSTTTTAAPTTTTTTVAPSYWNGTYCPGQALSGSVALRDNTSLLTTGSIIRFTGGGDNYCATLQTKQNGPFFFGFTIVASGFVDCPSCTGATTTTTTSTTSTTTTTAAPFFYYNAINCQTGAGTNIRSVTPLTIGSVVKINFLNGCYQITSVGPAFGFDYDSVFVDCPTCVGTLPTTTTTAGPTTTTTTAASCTNNYNYNGRTNNYNYNNHKYNYNNNRSTYNYYNNCWNYNNHYCSSNYNNYNCTMC